jgi:branched-subunit amino acid ABC-type transport system permease component
MSEALAALVAGIAQGVPLFIVASGLTLIFGLLHVLNFAHGAFFMLGAFLVATFLGGQGVNPLVFLAAALAAAAVLAVVGSVTDTVVFKRLYGRDHMVTLLASYALLLMLEGLTTELWGVEPRVQRQAPAFAGSVSLFGLQVAVYDLVLVVIGLVIAVGLFWMLQRTAYGKTVRAVATDEQMARALGIRARRVQTGVFALGAGLAGLGGALMAPLVSVDVGLAPSFAIQSFAVVIIGGLGSVSGALVAALIIGVSESLLVSYAPEVGGFSLYIAVALVLMLRPQGLLGKRTVRAGA